MIERALITALVAVAVLFTASTAANAVRDTFTELNCDLDGVQVCVMNEESE